MRRLHTASLILFIWAAFFLLLRVSYAEDGPAPQAPYPRECGAGGNAPRDECSYKVWAI